MDTADILFLILLIGVLVGGYAWHRRRLLTAGRNWKKIARRYGGTFKSDGGGWIVEPNYVVTCEVDGVEVTLDYDVTSTGSSTSYRTRVTTACPVDVQFDIYREGMLEKVDKALGRQDVRIGDDEYDRVFMIKSDDAKRVREVCNVTVRARHLESPGVRIQAADGVLKLIQSGVVFEMKSSVRMLEFAALVSARLQA